MLVTVFTSLKWKVRLFNRDRKNLGPQELQPSVLTTTPSHIYICIVMYSYRKDTEPFYHSFMNSLASLLSGIYPLPAMHSLLVTLYVTANLIGINRWQNPALVA